jgi:hypothetical protein
VAAAGSANAVARKIRSVHWGALMASAGMGVLSIPCFVVAETGVADWWWLAAWCVAASTMLLPALWCVAGDWRVWIAEPVVTAFLAFFLYYVIGAAVAIVWREHPDMDARLLVTQATPPSLIRAYGACSIGLALAVIGYEASSRLPPSRLLLQCVGALPRVPARSLSSTLVLIGIAAKLLEIYCWLHSATPPWLQPIRMVANLGLAGIALAFWKRPKGKATTESIASGLLVFVSLIFGAILLSKQEALKPIVAVMLGLGLRRTGLLSKLGLIGIPILLAVSMVTIVNVARIEVLSGSTDGIEVRARALLAASNDEQTSESLPIVRLHYTATQVAVMDLYDQGVHGHDFQLLPWMFVPRILAPEKPRISDSGARVYELMTGQTGSSDSPGVFVEGYFNAGWPGLIISSLFYGYALGHFALIGRKVAVGGISWLAFPLLLLGHFMALRIDGHILSDLLGNWVYMWFALVAITFVTTSTADRRSYTC